MLIANICTLLRDASWNSCFPDYRPKPALHFHSPRCSSRGVHKQQSRMGGSETLHPVLRGGECVLRAREISREWNSPRTLVKVLVHMPLCAWRVEGEVRGWSTRNSGKSFRGCQGCPQGNRRSLLFPQTGGTNNTRISRGLGGFMMSDRGN